MRTAKITLPAGKYWIGDPCYAVPDDMWPSLLENSDYLNRPGSIDGVEVVAFSTAYGDGRYEDQNKKEYPVDAGIIGIILADEVERWNQDSKKHGNIYEFEKEFVCQTNYGDMNFGHIYIDTDGSSDDSGDDE